MLASAFNYFAYAWAARRSSASHVTAFTPLQVVVAATLQARMHAPLYSAHGTQRTRGDGRKHSPTPLQSHAARRCSAYAHLQRDTCTRLVLRTVCAASHRRRQPAQVLVLGEWPTAAQLGGAAAIVVALFCIVASLAYASRGDTPNAAVAEDATVADTERELESPEE